MYAVVIDTPIPVVVIVHTTADNAMSDFQNSLGMHSLKMATLIVSFKSNSYIIPHTTHTYRNLFANQRKFMLEIFKKSQV